MYHPSGTWLAHTSTNTGEGGGRSRHLVAAKVFALQRVRYSLTMAGLASSPCSRVGILSTSGALPRRGRWSLVAWASLLCDGRASFTQAQRRGLSSLATVSPESSCCGWAGVFALPQCPPRQQQEVCPREVRQQHGCITASQPMAPWHYRAPRTQLPLSVLISLLS